ncbi:MAG: YtxH domain-containing protein [Gemmatimonadetes bacterium]|nr:YtxH domain-containing protein [Gemmatimonadota bacterium]
MRDRDDVPYIVVERQGSGIAPFLLGALLGAGVALLLAPRSGAETQEQIKEGMRKLRDSAEQRARQVQRSVEARLEQARVGAQDAIDAARDAVEAGRQAARTARVDLEKKVEQSKAAFRAGIDAARSTTVPEAHGNEADA